MRIEQADRAIGLDELHQVLVGRDDGDLAAAFCILRA
jgi:hypothetical protein